jgi:hypothetical protein
LDDLRFGGLRLQLSAYHKNLQTRRKNQSNSDRQESGPLKKMALPSGSAHTPSQLQNKRF